MDLSGQRFGRLLVVRKTDEKDKWGRCYLYECRCDCGGTVLVTPTLLRSGQVRSCGCLQRENRLRDITGERFGRLVALEPTGEIRNGSALWRCRCDCGREDVFPLGSLRFGNRRSCGCLERETKARQAIAMQEHLGRTDGTALASLRSKRERDNSSGRVGVSYNATNKKWYARAQLQGRTYWLGAHPTREAAIRARERFERERI